jgi:uncharacterized protein YciI
MKVAVHCLDHLGAEKSRLENYAAHKTYLGLGSTVKTVISGPLLAEDGETMIGSLFVFEAETLEDVIAFNRADPFNQAGVWAQVSIRQFNLRVDNRE